jgi:hypothetical protein
MSEKQQPTEISVAMAVLMPMGIVLLFAAVVYLVGVS